MSRAHLSILLALVALLGGCLQPRQPDDDEPEEPQPASVLLRFKPGPNLNPNDLGEPTPVDVRLYPLSEYTGFTESSFEELWTNDAEILGDALVGQRKVLTFEPAPEEARAQASEFTFPADARFLGVMGLFSAERKQGLEERKVVLTRDEARTKTIYLKEHAIELEDGQ